MTISCQLSTVALLHLQFVAVSEERQPTSNVSAAWRHGHDRRRVVCEKATVVPPVTGMINGCEGGVKAFIRMLNHGDQFWGQKKILSYDNHFLACPILLLLYGSLPENSFYMC